MLWQKKVARNGMTLMIKMGRRQHQVAAQPLRKQILLPAVSAGFSTSKSYKYNYHSNACVVAFLFLMPG